MLLQDYLIFSAKLFAILVGSIYWRRFTLPYKILAVQCLLAFGVEAIGRYINQASGGNNTWLFNFYCLVELAVHSYIGYLLLSRKSRQAILVGLAILLMFWLYSFFTDGQNRFFNWYVVVHCFFLLILYTVVLMTRVLFSQKLLWKQSLFLICIASIIYYACTIPLFGMLNYIVDSNVKMAKGLFYISHIADVLRYILVAIAFYLYGIEAKKQHVPQ